MKKLAVLLSLLVVFVTGSNSWASLTTGSLSTPLLFDSTAYPVQPYTDRIPVANAPGGLVATAAWDQYGMKLSWNVTNNNGVYTYTYNFGPGWYPATQPTSGSNLDPYVTNKQITGFDIQLGAGMDLSSLSNLTWSVSSFNNTLKGSGTATSYTIGSTTTTKSLITVGSLTGETGYSTPVYMEGHEGDSEYIIDWTGHYTTNTLFNGIRWENPVVGNSNLFKDDVNFTLSFQTTVAPGWGNFFANSSQTGANNNYSDVVAFNSSRTGYSPNALDGSIVFNNLVAVAGGAAPVPIPPSMLLFASGVSGLFMFRRKKIAV